MITSALHVLALAVGVLDAASIHLVADRAEHLAQLLDDPEQAQHAYRTIGTLRAIADAVDGEAPGG